MSSDEESGSEYEASKEEKDEEQDDNEEEEGKKKRPWKLRLGKKKKKEETPKPQKKEGRGRGRPCLGESKLTANQKSQRYRERRQGITLLCPVKNCKKSVMNGRVDSLVSHVAHAHNVRVELAKKKVREWNNVVTKNAKN